MTFLIEMIKTIYGKASILAVGTELTTGQVINRNAAWISEQLIRLGIDVVLHETVADDRPRIKGALIRCAQVSQLIFVTGGLGPTKDDFTREVIADWLEKPLEFQESLWQRVVDRLTLAGVPVAESNRQQCFFPRGSQIIINHEGTAAGFTSSLGENQQIWVFPGPPREVSSVWQQGIEQHIFTLAPNCTPLHLLTWQCMGKSEAELGEITEGALEGSGLQTGYRATRPFVEIKIWYTEVDLPRVKPWIEKLERAIAPWVITKQGEDLAERLLLRLQGEETVEVIDSGSGGILANRLGSILRKPTHEELRDSLTLATEWKTPTDPQDWVSKVLMQADHQTTTLVLSGIAISDGNAMIGLRHATKNYSEMIQLPYRRIELLDRMRYFLVEIALKKWCDWLSISIH